MDLKIYQVQFIEVEYKNSNLFMHMMKLRKNIECELS